MDRARVITGLPLVCFWVQYSAWGAELSPHAQAQPVALADARWTTGFWADRFERCRVHTLPALGRLMEDTNHTHFLRNFEIAAGLAHGRHRGAPFNDGEVYKCLQAASAVYAVAPSEDLRRDLDRTVGIIAQAQRADGYLHTPVQVAQRNGDTKVAAFQDRNQFEMYNLGHLFTAACAHHQATGQSNLLTVATRAADFLCRSFLTATPEAARSSVCPSHYMGTVALYRETGDPRYLELAKQFFALRAQITDGGDDNQDRIPFGLQTNAMGHAVRANYLYAGAADLFMETGDPALWRPLESIWHNVTAQKMYITGACGALFDGASPYGAKAQKTITRTHQAYGHNYELPNTTAHNETCANIGNVLWNWRMFLVTGEARFMDVAELALYNSVLSGVSLDGTNFFYTNPLRVTDPLPTDLRWPRGRVPFLSSFCCPPNLARTIAGSAQFAYARSGEAIWVNLYGASRLETELAGLGKVKLAQETEYPWSGRVRIRILAAPDKAFALKLRIPGWVRRASLRVNLRPAHTALQPASYHELCRVWKSGDVLDLDLPMPVALVEAHPLVEEVSGQVAVKRGPVVYCLESPDLPERVRVSEVAIPAEVRFRARHDARLLGGVVVLETTLLASAGGEWTGQLYRERRHRDRRPIQARLIPYSVWANRRPSEMSVWLPLVEAGK